MGPQFAQTCRDFTEKIRKLGPIYPNLRGITYPDHTLAAVAL